MYTLIAMGEDELGAVGEFAFIDTLRHFPTREAAETFADSNGIAELDVDLYQGRLARPNPRHLIATRPSGSAWRAA